MSDENCENPFILEVQSLRKHYGKVTALNGIDLAFRRGELTSLIGPNGSGKTTFYNVVTGRYRPSSGRVLFGGRDIGGMAPHRVVRLGIARSFQINNIFADLSVFENFRAAVIAHSGARLNLFRHVDSYPAIRERALELLDLVSLLDVQEKQCSEISYGDMRKVEIGLALAGRPSLLFLDEPTAGMTPEETRAMVALIRRIADTTKTTVVITEHDMSVVFTVSERIVVLSYGDVLADGAPAEIRRNEKVRAAYLGREVTQC